MKTLVLAISALVIATAGASAADLAARPYTKAPPMPVEVYNWTGFYVGGNVGGAWNDTRDDVFPTGCFLTSVTCGGGVALNPLRSDSTRLNGSGFTGGAQAGYNWQRDRWLVGVEADINYLGINDGNAVNRPTAPPLVGNFIHSE